MKYIKTLFIILLSLSLPVNAYAQSKPPSPQQQARSFSGLGKHYEIFYRDQLSKGDWETAEGLYQLGEMGEKVGDKASGRKLQLSGLEYMEKSLAISEKNPANRDLVVKRLIQIMPYYLKAGKNDKAKITISKIARAYEDPKNPYRPWIEHEIEKGHPRFLTNMSTWYLSLGFPQQSQKYKGFLAALRQKRKKDMASEQKNLLSEAAWHTKLTAEEQKVFTLYVQNSITKRISLNYEPALVTQLPSNFQTITVLFTIMQNGSLTNVKLLNPSSVEGLNQAVLKAVRDASPMDALPEALKREYINTSQQFGFHNPRYSEFEIE